jgi:citrate synthase
MADKIITQLSDIISNTDRPDQQKLRDNNINLGLRDDQGAGIVVGATTKGCVIGYEKEPLAKFIGEDGEGHEVDPILLYETLNGKTPTSTELKSFIPKAREILPYKMKPVEGQLFYSGIEINDIVNAHKETFGYEEVAYLLLTGELPNKEKLADFVTYMRSRRSLPSGYRNSLIHQFSTNNLMNSLQTAVDNLYYLDENPDSILVEDITRHSIDLIAKFPSLVAYAYQGYMYKYNDADLNIIFPSTNVSPAEDFLRMFNPNKKYTSDQIKMLDTFLILHAEHGGGNNSTFTTRVVSSTETDTFSSISSGLASLKGPLHGGANEKVMAMMKGIMNNVKDWNDNEEIYGYLNKIIKKEVGDKSGKIYGLGHAVYTLSDPRAIIIRREAEKLALESGRLDELYLYDKIAKLGPIAFQKVKGHSKVICPNVDFYSGFVLDCLSIPKEIYTPLFAMARVSGWCAHRLEQLVQNRIIRPAYFELIEPRKYVALDQRT